MTKTDAEAELAKIVQPINESRGAADYSLQGYVRDVVWPWYRRKWKWSTASTTEHRTDHYLLKELGIKPLSWFTRVNLQEHLDKLAKRDLSTSTIAHLRWDLRQIFKMAVNDGLLQRNPAELLHATKGTRRPRRVLAMQELRTILAALPLRDRLIISLAGISGLRPGEILSLQWGDLHEDGLHIQRGIYRNHIQTPKTHHSIRTAAISASTRDDLIAWKQNCPTTDNDAWIFPNEKGNRPLAHANYWRRNLKPKLDKLEIDGVTFQALRRTAITLLNETGHADPTVIAAQAGHTVDVSLNIYNRVGIQRQQASLDLLEAALSARPKRKNPFIKT